MIRALLLLIGLATAAPLAAQKPGTPFADAMDDAAQWRGEGSDSVLASSGPTRGFVSGQAIALRYDFGRVSGYAFMRRELNLALPPGYELSFRLRGSGGRNDLQLKLTAGDTVFWKTWPNFRAPREWTVVRVRASEIVFAWGPDPKLKPVRIDGIEFVVARNRDGGAGAIEIDDLRIVPAAAVAVVVKSPDIDPNDALAVLASAAPRGDFPRAFLGEQPYWTLAGSDGGQVAALISEDGAIEPFKGGFSVEPQLVVDGSRFTWANSAPRQSLADSYLPVPSVVWRAGEVELETTLLVDPAGAGLRAGHLLTNRGRTKRQVRLELAVRPWQVNPPAQFLSQRGGYSRIHGIVRDGAGVAITMPGPEDETSIVRRVLASQSPDEVHIGEIGRAPALPPGLATAVMVFATTLAPGESHRISLAVPRGDGAVADWATLERESRVHWGERLGRVKITVPPAHQAVADTVRTALAHMLMSREGPMLKPGTRSYDRAWIRDGAMMGEALLRLGSPQEARAFADWYRGHLFPNGKVPCCVDFRGADPVPENDSHGEYIFLVAQLHRFTGDRAALKADWPGVLAAWRYMEKLRATTRIPANLTPEKRMLYGLMPASISHEGYSAKPQFSLWDDFWALRGYRDAAAIAERLGAPEAAAIGASRDQFAADLEAAIGAAARHWKIDYIPGATSLGDFDATSTTVALDPTEVRDILDPVMLEATFERYWGEFVARRDGQRAWKDYTPYELRNVGAFVRLGWRERAQELLTWFLADRRPLAWNGWAEVVGRNTREVRFIGDMPHAWVASDFLRSALDLFAYSDGTGTVVLGGGLTADWLAGPGSGIRGLATEYGPLDVAMRGDARKLRLSIGGTAKPPGGFVYDWPYAVSPPSARIGKNRLLWTGRRLAIPATGRPQVVEIGQ